MNFFTDPVNIEFPSALSSMLLGLYERNLMTPTAISALAMKAILPGQIILNQQDRKLLVNQDDETITYTRPVHFEDEEGRSIWKPRTTVIQFPEDHSFTLFQFHNLETLEMLSKSGGDEYVMVCVGNAADGIAAGLFEDLDENKNYIFWNYPGIGDSTGSTKSPQDLAAAGYQQIKRILDKGIPANKITVYGHSLGGAVALKAVERLYAEKQFVNLTVDRSFAKIAPVANGLINNLAKKFPQYAALGTSIIALGISGVALGATFAGFVASVGLVAASSTAAIGYIGAYCALAVGVILRQGMHILGKLLAAPFFYAPKLQHQIEHIFNLIGDCLAYPFELSAKIINKLFNTLGTLINTVVNFAGSVVGGAISVVGALAGCLLGAVFGALLSVQLLWTKEPLTIPLTPFFSAGLLGLACEMNSAKTLSNISQKLATEKAANQEISAKIKVINSPIDDIIDESAALLTALGENPSGIKYDWVDMDHNDAMQI